jgi:hypothetical protein
MVAAAWPLAAHAQPLARSRKAHFLILRIDLEYGPGGERLGWRRRLETVMRGVVMKIAVIGGTGSKVVEKLKQRGHEVIAAAPSTGVNTITGEGPRPPRKRPA